MRSYVIGLVFLLLAASIQAVNKKPSFGSAVLTPSDVDDGNNSTAAEEDPAGSDDGNSSTTVEGDLAGNGDVSNSTASEVDPAEDESGTRYPRIRINETSRGISF